MSEQPQPQIRDTYPLPEDQLAMEVSLHEQYETEYGEAWADTLGEAIHSIGAVTGEVSHSGFEFVGRIDGKDEPALTAPIDEAGFLPYSPGGTRFSKVRIIPPYETDNVDVGTMSDEDRFRYDAADSGYVMGDVPAETTRLLDDLYTLTGASLVRDFNPMSGGRHVVRQAEYHGKPFYLTEIHHEYSTGLRALSLLAERADREPQEELSKADLAKLNDLGMTSEEVFKAKAQGTIKHSTVDALAEELSRFQ